MNHCQTTISVPILSTQTGKKITIKFQCNR
uniref:Uncharacterized protein n=1 Tax=Arundo donax TaxID=35708 RepID=A0A0A9A480_ARUDO